MTTITPANTLGTRPIIDLNVAIKRAENWRGFLSSLRDEDDNPLVSPQYLFRAIHINMIDIEWLRAQHPEAQCFRIYMGIADLRYPGKISGMLVAVNNQNQDLVSEVMTGSAADSGVYDVTQPCPTVCDTQSPLFSE